VKLSVSLPGREASECFACFGGSCTVLVTGGGPAGTASEAVAHARNRLLDWHQQLSRFERDSELSQLNRDPRETVPVSAVMARFLESACRAAEVTGGLVDPTLIGELERGGYADHFERAALPLAAALSRARPREPARPNPGARWRSVTVDRRAGTVTRPPGLRLDTGGIAKGMFGDILATALAGHESYAVDAAGDVRLGGAGGHLREVRVASPFDASVLHVFECSQGAAATSGIGKRIWLDPDGLPAHHLLDPASGRPAFTGIVQATALAPTATEAEVLAKAALLSGPDGARGWLAHGGVVVFDDGELEVIEPDHRLIRAVAA
jgi:thiamine biosynthesis lipoprotein